MLNPPGLSGEPVSVYSIKECVQLYGKSTSASVERIIRMYPVNRYTLCFSNKKEERANGYIAHKALSRGKYLSCIPKHTTQDGIQSSLSAPRAPESG